MSYPYTQSEHDEAASVGALILLVASVPIIIAVITSLLSSVMPS